jgi:hypothetical protein
MTRTHRRVLAALIVLIAAACAPGYLTIYDAGTNYRDTNGDQGTNKTVTLNTTSPATGTGAGSSQTFDALDATWSVDCTGATSGAGSKYAVRWRGTATDDGMFGGTVTGTHSGAVTWDNYHYCTLLKAESSAFGVFDRLTLDGGGDLFKFGAGSGSQTGTNVRLSRSWLKVSHDDCVQNDEPLDGDAVEQNLLEHCWVGISSRPATSVDASGKVMDIDHTIVRVDDHDVCYKPADYGCPNHGGWLKWESDGSIALRLAARHSTWVATDYPTNDTLPDTDSGHWNGVGDLALNAPIASLDVDAEDGVNDSCDGNTFLYLGDDFGGAVHFLADVDTWSDSSDGGSIAGPCTHSTVLTGQDARDEYDTQVAAWHTTHDADLGDGS